MAGLQQTYQANLQNTRADFNRSDFETLIAQKGRNVILEKALQCPCKGKSTNQQSNCKNCGGTGWVFINPKETRLVLQGMNITPNFKAWSEEITGDLKVTASDTEELTFMDRLTLEDGRAIFNEVLFFKTRGTGSSAVTFAFTSYNIKEVKYIGYFKGTDQPFQKLNFGTDYTFDKNIIKIINPAIVPVQGDISVTIRYIHAPQYLMIDMKRESMETFVMEGTEKMVHLPISGTARRQHYILGAPNLNGNNLVSNDYEEVALPVNKTCC
jgi:hypothetical protein